MAIFTPKGPPPASDGAAGQVYHENSTHTTWGRLEPLLTADQLVLRYLAGIPLVSKLKDPITGKPFHFDKKTLEEYIKLAVNDAELETQLIFMPTRFAEKLPFIRQDFENWGHMKPSHRPIATVDKLTCQLADNSSVFEIPVEWVETANLVHGQINIVPLGFNAIQAGGGVIGGSGASAIMLHLTGRAWIPALFMVEYTAGFPNGMVPTPVNNLIGCIAAMRVLSMLGATHAKSMSSSLSIDGLGQSQSGPGPQVYAQRLAELGQEKALLVRRLRKQYASTLVTGDV